MTLGVAGALLGWFVYQQANDRYPVIALARAVPFGQPIELADLREASLPRGTDLSTMPWAEVDRVIGRLAATDLYAGQPLPPDAVRHAPIPEAGQAVIGIPVAPGQLPATPLEPHDEVLVIRSDDASSTVRATVLRVGDSDTSGRRTIDLLVQEGLVTSLAHAATDDRTLLVLVARR
ncbi:SAF domain-containing protein [Pseudonocardia nigra]|uniref:SAF domain-containing protein n=1 Tax=Pseudonocardia nigra TaxID=1921578 RepID=UPI001C5FA9F9|nr:SAF domain-containing protein [Pseudonocardia nigra]